MYAGRKVEEAPVDDAVRRPRHPYTRGLLVSMPQLGETLQASTARAAGRDPGHGAVAARPRSPAAPSRRAARCATEQLPARKRRRSRRRRPAHYAACFHSDRSRRDACMTAAPAVLEVANLRKHFPVRKGLFVAHRRAGARGRRHLVLDRRGRDARPGRRERLRQVDRRQDDPASWSSRPPATIRVRGAAHRGRSSGARCGRSGASCRWCSRTRTRRSTRACGRRHRRRAAASTTASRAAPSSTSASPRCSSKVGLRADQMVDATRTSSPAASASASASRARSRSTRS